MIQLIVGVPGSGKSYLAVHKMNSEVKPIWTNIPLNSNLGGKVVKKFEAWDEVVEIVKQLYPLRDKRDDCIQLANDLDFFGVALYYDECHMGLDRQIKELVWFFTWHRHLEFDIYLITQNKNAIVAKYRTLPEVFTLAVPASRRLRLSVFKYKDYAGFAMAKDQIRSFSLQSDQKIFELYQTGEFNKGTSEIRKRAYLFFIALLLFPFVIYSVYYFNFREKTTSSTSSISSDQNISVKVKENVLDTNESKSIEYDPFPVIVERIGNNLKFEGNFLILSRIDPDTQKILHDILKTKKLTKRVASTYTIYRFPLTTKVELNKLFSGWR